MGEESILDLLEIILSVSEYGPGLSSISPDCRIKIAIIETTTDENRKNRHLKVNPQFSSKFYQEGCV